MREETTGHHIFLEPEGTLGTELARCIATLAQENGGPLFPPHVTLAGPLEGQDEATVIDIATALAHESAPLSMTLGEQGWEDTYFRAFYIRIEESHDLTRLRERACAAFGIQPGSYLPHLSLFYGAVTDAARQDIALTASYPKGATFTATALSVYRTEGRAEDWQRIAHIPLTGTMLN